MYTKKYSSLLVIVILFLSSSQLCKGQAKTGDVMLDAMHDELTRNINELKLPDFNGPFYIMYGAQEQKSYLVAATLGSLQEYSETPYRFKTNTRILVGDYEFNDESLDDDHSSGPSFNDLELPSDDDYYGIRRSFWASTDNVYRDAARHFKKHQMTIKESKKELKDVPHRSFVKSDPVKLIKDFKPYDWQKGRYIDLARHLSGRFVGHPEIEVSAVMINFLEGKRYFVTSEGTVARVPFSQARFTAFAQVRSEDGEYTGDRVSFEGRTPDIFPDEKTLEKMIDELIKKVKEKNRGTEHEDEEEYTGPILVTGSATADLFAAVLLHSRESVIANDYIPKMKGFQQDQSWNMENKVGKLITHESLTIKAKPTLERYKNTDLLGSFLIDAEAMVPADEVLLIENGILKTLLNNRTITSTSKATLAHGFDNGPGVLEITSTIKNTEKELKDALIKKAKAEGLAYGIIARGGAMREMEIYKVYVSDGREELVKNLGFNASSLRNLKKLLGFSGSYSAYNLAGPYNQERGVVSVIVPDAVLVEEGQCEVISIPKMKVEKYISSPLE